MKLKYIVSMVMAFFMLNSTLMAAEESFVQQSDKQKHFVATTVISMAVTGYARNKGYSKVESFFWGFGAAIAVGLIKEGIDGKTGGQQSSDDLKADVLGGLTGALVSAQFEWKF